MITPATNEELAVSRAQNGSSRPFLRWPGGKSWLLGAAPELFRKGQKRLLDPFLGGGSFLFHVPHQDAIAGDINPDLMTTYQAVASNPAEVWETLQQHAQAHCGQYYLAQRSRRPTANIDIAARFIYLNHTSFNGLYRVNQAGHFNVPMGDRNVRTTLEELNRASDVLVNTELRTGDFQDICEQARRGDLLILDPPYTVKHDRNGFVRYNESIFTWSDQERLAVAAKEATLSGASVVITNANHDSVASLYPDSLFARIPMQRYSRVAGKPAGRTDCTEAVFIGKSS